MPPSDTVHDLKERVDMHDTILRGGPGEPGLLAGMLKITESNERVVQRLDAMDRREEESRKTAETERRSRNTQVGLLGLGVLGSGLLAWFNSVFK